MNSNFDENKILRNTAIIAGFSLLAKVLGVVRDAILANRFGNSITVDAYMAAFRIPDFIVNLLIVGTFSVAFIPIFSEWVLKDKKQAFRMASGIFNATLLAMCILSLVALVFVEPLTKAIVPGFEGEAFELTKLFTKIFLLSPIFFSLSSVASSVLNTYKRFALAAAAPVVYNLSIIAGVVWLYPNMGPAGLAWGVVLGAFLHFAIQLPQIYKIGFRYSFSVDFKHKGFLQFWKLFWPRIFSMGTSQVTLLVVTIFGSFLGTGALSAFYFANNLQSVFLGLFAISPAFVIFPLLSDLYNQNNENRFKDVIAKTTVQILYFIIPLSVLMLVLRAQAVRLVYGFGQGTNFDFEATRLVALTLGLMVVSSFAQGLIPLYTRAFYARHDTKIPVIIGLITIVLNVALTYYLVGKFGVPGMAMAFSISSIINLVLLIFELHHRVGHIHDEYLIINTLKIVIGSMAAGIATFISLYVIAPFVDMSTYWGVFTQGVGAGVVGVAAYLGASWFLGMSESQDVLKLLRGMVSKAAKPFSIISNIWS